MVNTKYSISRGFTLIELLIVISIIGTLVTLATFSYGNAQLRARDARRKQDLSDLKKALHLYYEDNSLYPSVINTSTIGPSYLSSLPTDPFTSASYIYAPAPASCTANCNSYSLTACLENANDIQKDTTKNGACTKSSYSITNPN